LGSKKIEEFNFRGPGVKSDVDNRILDTSVIIDGRIADICDSGFMDGELIVPRFVLNELQLVADSADSIKRSRGRRGLDILNRMQKSSNITIKIVEQDFPKVKGVDGKLVALAQKINAKLLTNDFNLNKVAELQGVRVLNINELANSMKPVVLPGEQMGVKIIREGKEPGQGVGYLDDGTMIIVDGAQKLLNANVEVIVTSVLQTTAGRMIFSELKEAAEKKSVQN
ncbi:MAG: PIN domain-containing protein, partial [Smithellaceae bacterium]